MNITPEMLKEGGSVSKWAMVGQGDHPVGHDAPCRRHEGFNFAGVFFSVPLTSHVIFRRCVSRYVPESKKSTSGDPVQ